MSFYYGKDNAGREHLMHDCFMRGKGQWVPNLLQITEFYSKYEDGYFRGLRKGAQSSWWEDSPNEYHAFKCKSCGERVFLDDVGNIIKVQSRDEYLK